MIYLNLFKAYQKKCKIPKYGLVVTSVVFEGVNSRFQVDFSDKQPKQMENLNLFLRIKITWLSAYNCIC